MALNLLLFLFFSVNVHAFFNEKETFSFSSETEILNILISMTEITNDLNAIALAKGGIIKVNKIILDSTKDSHSRHCHFKYTVTGILSRINSSPEPVSDEGTLSSKCRSK